jgi:thiamine biosynthesis lipoprotein
MRWNNRSAGFEPALPAAINRRLTRSHGRRIFLRALCFISISFILLSATDSAPATVFVHKKKYVMGTVFEIVAYGESPARLSDAINKAFQEIVRLDAVMSNYNSASDLSRLNRSAHFHAEVVPPDLYRVIEDSLLYSRLSGGKFDISVAPLVNLWKAAMRGDHMPSFAEEEKLRRCVGYQHILLFPPDRIEFRSPCLQIDLGAIGKGYAVDRAVEILRSYGVERALIDAGGSTIYAMGSPPGQPAWLVHLRDPSTKIDPRAMLCDDSVSTSEQTPATLLGSNSPGHIIDPEKAAPSKTTFAVSAIAKTATASDALSTTLLLIGPEKGKTIIKNMADAGAIWVSPTGETETASSGPQILLGRGL